MYFASIRFIFFVPHISQIKDSVDIISFSTFMIINISIIIDMFLSLHTGYYENGGIILDRKKIATRYIKGTFIYDILA